jgi:hypothetical protein
MRSLPEMQPGFKLPSRVQQGRGSSQAVPAPERVRLDEAARGVRDGRGGWPSLPLNGYNLCTAGPRSCCQD